MTKKTEVNPSSTFIGKVLETLKNNPVASLSLVLAAFAFLNTTMINHAINATNYARDDVRGATQHLDNIIKDVVVATHKLDGIDLKLSKVEMRLESLDVKSASNHHEILTSVRSIQKLRTDLDLLPTGSVNFVKDWQDQLKTIDELKAELARIRAALTNQKIRIE